MADKFLNLTQLQTFLTKVKEWSNSTFATKDVATPNADGLMAAADKTKLNGLENYTLPTLSTTVKGGAKIDGTTIIIDENDVLHATGSGGGGNVDDVTMDNESLVNSDKVAVLLTLTAADIEDIVGDTIVNTEGNVY